MSDDEAAPLPIIALDGSNCTAIMGDCGTCVQFSQCQHCVDGGADDGVSGYCIAATTECFSDAFSYSGDDSCGGGDEGPTRDEVFKTMLYVTIIFSFVLYLIIIGLPKPVIKFLQSAISFICRLGKKKDRISPSDKRKSNNNSTELQPLKTAPEP